MTFFPARGLQAAGGLDSARVAWGQICSAPSKSCGRSPRHGPLTTNAGDGADGAFPHTQIADVTRAVGTGSSTEPLTAST